MAEKKRLINRSNFLLVQEYLTYLLQTKNKNPKSVERYRFWLYHLLRWAMETPLEKAHKIETPISCLYERFRTCSRRSDFQA